MIIAWDCRSCTIQYSSLCDAWSRNVEHTALLFINVSNVCLMVIYQIDGGEGSNMLEIAWGGGSTGSRRLSLFLVMVDMGYLPRTPSVVHIVVHGPSQMACRVWTGDFLQSLFIWPCPTLPTPILPPTSPHPLIPTLLYKYSFLLPIFLRQGS